MMTLNKNVFNRYNRKECDTMFENLVNSLIGMALASENDHLDMTEMDKLAAGLDAKGIPYTRRSLFGGQQIDCGEWDAICHSGSYGHERGLIEIMGSIVNPDAGDEIEGYLTAEDILSRI